MIWQLVQFILDFLLVLLLLRFALRFLGGSRPGLPRSGLQVVEQVHLGRDRQILLLRYGEALFLVASTSQGISFLRDVAPLAAAAEVPLTVVRPSEGKVSPLRREGEFSARLAEISARLERRRSGSG